MCAEGHVLCSDQQKCQPMMLGRVPVFCEPDGLVQELPSQPLGFRSAVYQEVQLKRAAAGHKHSGAATASPVLLAVASGVVQAAAAAAAAEPSAFPQALLRECQRLAEARLGPGGECTGEYCGPIALLQEAFASTRATGAATVLVAAMDNASRIHGAVRPMLGVLTLGDSGMLLLRRSARRRHWEIVFCTDAAEPGAGGPAALRRPPPRPPDEPPGAGKARLVDDAAERSRIASCSLVRCVSVREGDLAVLGSNVLFDALAPLEIAEICNETLQRRSILARSPSFMAGAAGGGLALYDEVLAEVAERLAFAAHARGKPALPSKAVDDASVVVAEVVPWSLAVRGAGPGSRTLPDVSHGGG